MSGRDAIFRRLRTSLEVGDDDSARRQAVRTRLTDAPKGLIPKRGQLPLDERVALFCKMAEAVQSTVQRVPDASAVPHAVAELLRTRNLPSSVRMGADPLLRAMPWADVSTLQVLEGRSHGDDIATVSHAIGGIAETGTLVLHSGVDNPTTLNFLPEIHIIVIRITDIAGDMECIWEGLRKQFSKGGMPRVVNMITGPSRSADIEQKLILGAHGPRSLHVIITEN
ncbi:lactate utilization protein [Breoghania sp. L-A4]|uniref:LutC/YkgG family protein n=1 Tax=Breoghania sp. L-A4 TaxID=2304600 RepID=UPI000E360C68|nr:lactate utilization protein [Breoghania sp. L-A4]AXS39392.1 lactate utilization protein [Breoghania sp. L-A4]